MLMFVVIVVFVNKLVLFPSFVLQSAYFMCVYVTVIEDV